MESVVNPIPVENGVNTELIITCHKATSIDLFPRSVSIKFTAVIFELSFVQPLSLGHPVRIEITTIEIAGETNRNFKGKEF